MASKTDIANMALSHLGVGKEISNIETEQSQEASACRRFFDIARDAALADFNWPFAEKEAALNLIEELDGEYAFKYRYPTDCLRIRRIVSGLKNESNHEKRIYKIAKDDSGRVILTDYPQASVQYTQRVEDANFYTASFTLALSYRLAYYIASRLTKGDPFKIKRDLISEYTMEIEAAKKNVSNEIPNMPEAESEFIKARY